MVNDKEVKTAISPFAARQDEKKVYDGKEGFASINQIVFKMDMGYINESHIQALEVVNEFGFVTSRQVTQILELRGKLNDIEEDKRQSKVAKWLEDLTKSKVIARYFFQSETGKSSYRAYCIDKIATYILKQRKAEAINKELNPTPTNITNNFTNINVDPNMLNTLKNNQIDKELIEEKETPLIDVTKDNEDLKS